VLVYYCIKYTAAAALCIATCLTAWNVDNFKHEDGVYVPWGVAATLRGFVFSRDESLDNSVCRRVTDHKNPEDRETASETMDTNCHLRRVDCPK
jgi:hypothetical protein